MCLELGRQANDALVQRVARQALDRDDDRLVHLVGHDSPDLLLAHGCARCRAHLLPPLPVVAGTRPRRRVAGCGALTTARSSRSRSVITVKIRAIERRVAVSWLWSSSWRVASWKRRS